MVQPPSGGLAGLGVSRPHPPLPPPGQGGCGTGSLERQRWAPSPGCVPQPRLTGTSGTTCGTWGGRGGRGVREVKGVIWELLLPLQHRHPPGGSQQADEAAGPRPAGSRSAPASSAQSSVPHVCCQEVTLGQHLGPGALPSGSCFLPVLVPQGTSHPRLFPGQRFRPGLSASMSRRPALRLWGPGDKHLWGDPSRRTATLGRPVCM